MPKDIDQGWPNYGSLKDYLALQLIIMSKKGRYLDKQYEKGHIFMKSCKLGFPKIFNF